jgi:hypothetical protein
MSDAIRVMIDLETMSLEPNAAIVQIGGYVFQGELDSTNTHFDVYIKPESSERTGLHVDKDTMAWWDTQDALVRSGVFGGTYNIDEALIAFLDWCQHISHGDLKRLQVYCRGPEFDWVVLKNACEKVLGQWPLSYKSPQSSRTLDDIAAYVGMKVPEFDNAQIHNAHADAYYQGRKAVYILTHLANA